VIVSARAWRAALCLTIAWGAVPACATAQVYIGRDVPHGGTLEITGGGVWSGGFDLGSVSAEETRNTGTGTGPFVLFAVSSRMNSAPAAQGRLGVYLAKAASIEAGVLFARPKASSRLTGDAEGAPDITATETLTRLVVDGSLVLHLNGLSFAAGKGVPFVLGGGGYIRELHEKNEAIETGREYHAGAGLHFWLGNGGKHRAGLRTDVGVSMRTGGADIANTRRTVPTVGVSFAYLF
jgi:hypothetical protein